MSPDISGFVNKKKEILQKLAVPDTEYTDLSPKGSVDKPIRELIQEINDIDGIVTTSSCSGRISVFLEGSQHHVLDYDVLESLRKDPENYATRPSTTTTKVAAGGKGGGRWLFVTHDPIVISREPNISSLFGLRMDETKSCITSTEGLRLIRLQFEPFILHIMAASLKHAQPVLSAAVNSGFRESGVQSLRNLDDPKACPMVAIRTNGLTLESIIGYAVTEDEQENLYSFVTEEYIQMLINIGNERFKANSQRIERFRTNLLAAITPKKPDREDPETRRARKREEGLRRKEEMRIKHNDSKSEDQPEQVDTGYQPSGCRDHEDLENKMTIA
ncbi:MAG: hypothetical protein M1834_009293 [Cirrosporium novae-zelandiae]|nr:MAG: hypothetical protein M1834_009293 [Cirrosporium novae-zelandiae]